MARLSKQDIEILEAALIGYQKHREELEQKIADLRSLMRGSAGTNSAESTDYPDYAGAVAHDVVSGAADRGILVCSTGVGMSIAANKVDGIRAALAVNPEEVRLTRAHNDANIITIGARYTDPQTANEMVRVFLETPFEGGRHARRIGKIAQLEKES